MGVFRGDFVAVFNRFLFKFILSLKTLIQPFKTLSTFT